MENIVWKTLWKPNGKSWDIRRFPYLCSPYSRPMERRMESPMENHTSTFHPYAHPMLTLWNLTGYTYGNLFRRYGIPWERCFHMDDIPMEQRSIGIIYPGKRISIRRIYLWKAFSTGTVSLGKPVSIRMIYLWTVLP